MKTITPFLVGIYLFLNVTSEAMARNDYDRDLFLDCKDYAMEISGYYGRVPDRYLPGGALEGAMRGSVKARGLAWISGGNKEQRKKASKRGAALGALIGSVKKAEARREQRERRRMYQRELQRCMSR